MIDKELCTIQQASEITGIPRRTISYWAKHNKIKSQKNQFGFWLVSVMEVNNINSKIIENKKGLKMITKKNVNELVGSQFNPPSRIEGTKLNMLKKSMSENGFFEWCPIILGKDGKVADGHRRLEAAKQVGIKEVPTIQVDMDTEKIWIILNAQRMNIGSNDYGYAYVNGIDKSVIDNIIPGFSAANEINRVINIGGEELLLKIVLAKLSPSLIRLAVRIASYCGETRNEEFVKKAANWLVDFRMQWAVRTFIKMQLDPMMLYKAVLDNRPVSLVGKID